MNVQPITRALRRKYLLILRIFIISVILCPLGAAPGRALDISAKNDLYSLGLEELMNIQITSVSKKAQRLSDAAAAVFVITHEDIWRSGVTTIPDALRMVPGVQVAKIDANKWAVSIRGFNGRFANKLLVLMDGRSLYTPLFSGVFWDVQDTSLEDIDRIEVIRGPGAALWGANAVDGVINIITKSAQETLGGFVSAGVGTEERSFATARYGMSLSEATELRFFAKYSDHDDGVDASGNDTHDSWHTTRGGFRMDSNPTDRDAFTMTGDYYTGQYGETNTLFKLPTFLDPTTSTTSNKDYDISGGHILTRWERTLSDTSGFSLQLYYDDTYQEMISTRGRVDTVDLDFQHRFDFSSTQNIIWGFGYRFTHDTIDNSFNVSFDPSSEDYQLFSAFIHDEISLVPEKLSLILGSRFEHNDFSGFEVQPNGRLIYTPTANHTFWAAISRAVRTPSRGDRDIVAVNSVIPPPLAPPPLHQLPAVATIYGSEDFQSEDLVSYELGYRTKPLTSVAIDIATFYNRYNHLRTVRQGQMGVDSPITPTHFVVPYITNNDMNGYTYGAELTASWIPVPWWRLQATYSYLKIVMELDNNATDPVNNQLKNDAEGGSPRHQFSLRSGFNIGKQVELDLWARGIGRLDSIGGGSIPGYATLDAQLAWKPLQHMEFSLVGQNLLHSRNQEFLPEMLNTLPTEVERSVYGKVTWKF